MVLIPLLVSDLVKSVWSAPSISIGVLDQGSTEGFGLRPKAEVFEPSASASVAELFGQIFGLRPLNHIHLNVQKLHFKRNRFGNFCFHMNIILHKFMIF